MSGAGARINATAIGVIAGRTTISIAPRRLEHPLLAVFETALLADRLISMRDGAFLLVAATDGPRAAPTPMPFDELDEVTIFSAPGTG